MKYYLWQLLQALTYIHHNLIIHRDLKLGNFFLNDQLQLKVGDFGLATTLCSPSERRKTVCGTPNYIAPEIIDGTVVVIEVKEVIRTKWTSGAQASSLILFCLGNLPSRRMRSKTPMKRLKPVIIFFPKLMFLTLQKISSSKCSC